MYRGSMHRAIGCKGTLDWIPDIVSNRLIGKCETVRGEIENLVLDAMYLNISNSIIPTAQNCISILNYRVDLLGGEVRAIQLQQPRQILTAV